MYIIFKYFKLSFRINSHIHTDVTGSYLFKNSFSQIEVDTNKM